MKTAGAPRSTRGGGAQRRPATLAADLRRTEAYPALGASRVDVEETHISWVFLLEGDVFKVKKPVDLGFLDFRTKEQRRAACDAEVRLNARLAPDVYRGVVPVRRGGDGRCLIGGDGAIVDWAVHMKRLSDHDRADRRLARGELSGEQLDRVARRMATFHGCSRADAKTERFGSPQVIRQNVEENFVQTKDSIGRYLRAAEADEIVLWQTSFVQDHEALFLDRARGGRVRDGHGDLRLEHVYVDDGGTVTIIDCIEFNERFRFADVCADVAFLSMDLAGLGHTDLAERFIASYARESNDFDLYALVDFYESYRAFVRAKISGMVAADDSMDSAARERARRDARRYFLLALSADRKPLLRPSLVAVGGIIACGKSTIAERLGAEMSAPVIDADRTRKGMLGVDAESRLEHGAWQGAYDRAFTDEVYREVLRRAAVVLASGRPVVLDASFRSPAMRMAARDLASVHGVPFRFIECRADPDVCRARLVERERTGGVSDGRLEIFDAFASSFERATEVPPGDRLELDTTRPLAESLAALRGWVGTWPPGFAG